VKNYLMTLLFSQHLTIECFQILITYKLQQFFD